jgi:hypothetical protein
MQIVYNLFNKKNGMAAVVTDNKTLLEKYINMGYTLISVIWK